MFALAAGRKKGDPTGRNLTTIYSTFYSAEACKKKNVHKTMMPIMFGAGDFILFWSPLSLFSPSPMAERERRERRCWHFANNFCPPHHHPPDSSRSLAGADATQKASKTNERLLTAPTQYQQTEIGKEGGRSLTRRSAGREGQPIGKLNFLSRFCLLPGSAKRK